MLRVPRRVGVHEGQRAMEVPQLQGQRVHRVTTVREAVCGGCAEDETLLPRHAPEERHG